MSFLTTEEKSYHDKQRYSCSSRSIFYDDHSDRILLDNLLKKLEATPLKKSVQDTNASPTSSKYKQLPISRYIQSSENSRSNLSRACRKSVKVQDSVRKPETEKVNRRHTKKQTLDKLVCGKIEKRTKTVKTSGKLAKLDGWLSKNMVTCDENNSVVEKVTGKFKNKKDVLVESSNNKKSPVVENRKTLKRYSSGSFAKYGMCIPSFEDILSYQKKFEDQKQYVDNLIVSEDSQESLELNIDEPEVPTAILDCKHLDENDIREAYEHHSQYVHDIFNGIQYSARHERFKKQNCKDHFTVKDLKYNTSMISFTYEQKQQLLTRLHEEFDKEEGLPRNNQYLLKVLLPELCLNIFMDVHNMNRDEATSYLENRPIVY